MRQHRIIAEIRRIEKEPDVTSISPCIIDWRVLVVTIG
jgi:uncharacterized protein (DUF433 family)